MSFGANLGDLDGDGDLELYVSSLDRNLDNQPVEPSGSFDRLYDNDGELDSWAESGLAVGLDVPPLDEGQEWSGWSIEVADFDNDGIEDMAVAGGFPLAGPTDPVAEAFLEGDMSADDASVVYTVSGIPTRLDPYWVRAFLDEDSNDTLTSGDIQATTDGVSHPTVVVQIGGEGVPFDIELNTLVP